MIYEHPIKCMNCSLHYVVLSDHKNWSEAQTAAGFCPECGVQGGKMTFAPRENDTQIFMVVPGEQAHTGMYPVVQKSIGLGAPTLRRMEGRGPFGTNEGDTWLANQALNSTDENGTELVACISMIRRDGVLQEGVYLTANPEMIAEAREGHEKYIAAKAEQS